MTIYREDDFKALLVEAMTVAAKADAVFSEIYRSGIGHIGAPAYMALAHNIYGAVAAASDGIVSDNELEELASRVDRGFRSGEAVE